MNPRATKSTNAQLVSQRSFISSSSRRLPPSSAATSRHHGGVVAVECLVEDLLDPRLSDRRVPWTRLARLGVLGLNVERVIEVVRELPRWSEGLVAHQCEFVGCEPVYVVGDSRVRNFLVRPPEPIALPRPFARGDVDLPSLGVNTTYPGSGCPIMGHRQVGFNGPALVGSKDSRRQWSSVCHKRPLYDAKADAASSAAVVVDLGHDLVVGTMQRHLDDEFR